MSWIYLSSKSSKIYKYANKKVFPRTGEGTFEVPRKRTPAKPKVEDHEDRIQTIAEQKMNKSLKKIQKSKIPKWNPNDWQIDDGKARVRIKGRHWDDVSVPRWVQNCDTDRSENRKTVLKCCFLCNFPPQF